MKTRLGAMPAAMTASISLSEDSLPAVMREPTSDAKGKDMAITEGMAYMSNSTTSLRGAFLERMSSAMRRIWFTKKTAKKKRKQTTKPKRNSRET